MDPTAPSDTQNVNTQEEVEATPDASSVGETDLPPESPSATNPKFSPQADISEDTSVPEEPAVQKESVIQEEPVLEENTATQNLSPQTTLNQDPAFESPQVFTSQIQTPQEAMVDSSGIRSRKPLLFLLVLLFLVLILTGLGGLTYAIAYEKIKLEKYPDMQKKVSAFVMELPFMPKTAKFLLAKTALAHQNITKQSFDISVAIDSADLTSSLGLSNLDIQAKGAFDYSDPRNVFGNLELSFTKDFNMELKKKDKMVYFKVNKLPSFLFAFLGIGSANFDPVLDKWVSYDTTPLDTEARKSIQEDSEVDPLSEEFVDENFNKYIDEEVLSKLHLGSDTVEGHAVYKITLDADSDLIDYLGKKIDEASRQKSNYAYPQSTTTEPNKLSDFIKTLRWEMYIDKETYFTRKAIVTIDLEYDSSNGLGTFSLGGLINPTASKNNAKIALAAKFDKFGEEVVVEAPTESMSFEEFTNLLSSAVSEIYGGAIGSTQDQVKQARDARRKMDLNTLRSSLEFYFVDCGKYPIELSSLASTQTSDGCLTDGKTYLSTIPSDPDGSKYYYKVSDERSSYIMCANLEIPLTPPGSCPDPSFNYYVSSESTGY